MTFDELDRLLRRAGAPVDAAECHGALCGVLCAPSPDVDVWLAHVLEGVEAADARRALAALAEEMSRRLRGGDFEFSPCLPDDDVALVERVASLGEWCEGFLFGLGSARITDYDALPDAAQEIVRDVIELARVGLPAGDDDDGDEQAYSDLVEYLRAGIQLLHDELNPAPPSPVLNAPPRVH